MKCNLHTHTRRCGHAEGEDEAYVQAAIAAGYDVLGFSDHAPFPNMTFGMRPEALEGYLALVQELREKYRGQIRILVGLECEPIPQFEGHLRQLRRQVDYMLLGNHWNGRPGLLHTSQLREPKQLWRYYEDAVYGMETGLFLYLCHPDIMLAGYPRFDETARRVSRALCREANRLGLPLEYNLLGRWKERRADQLGYPCPAFWEVAAEENARAVIGVDAHAPGQLTRADYAGAEGFLKGLGLRVTANPLGGGQFP